MRRIRKAFFTATLCIQYLITCTVVRLVSSGCLDFVDVRALPTCYRGVFLCVGEEDENCYEGEHQLQLHIAAKSWDHMRGVGEMVLKFEDEGPVPSRIDTIWIEDEYYLLGKLVDEAPLQQTQGLKYNLVSNTTVFNEALAHRMVFDQHFVVSCIMQDKRTTPSSSWIPSSTKKSSLAQVKPVDGVPLCAQNSAVANRYESVSFTFLSHCTAIELKYALGVGLIRAGVQMGNFPSAPQVKSFITCQDVIEVASFDEKRRSDLQIFEDMYLYDEEDGYYEYQEPDEVVLTRQEEDSIIRRRAK